MSVLSETTSAKGRKRGSPVEKEDKTELKTQDPQAQETGGKRQRGADESESQLLERLAREFPPSWPHWKLHLFLGSPLSSEGLSYFRSLDIEGEVGEEIPITQLAQQVQRRISHQFFRIAPYHRTEEGTWVRCNRNATPKGPWICESHLPDLRACPGALPRWLMCLEVKFPSRPLSPEAEQLCCYLNKRNELRLDGLMDYDDAAHKYKLRGFGLIGVNDWTKKVKPEFDSEKVIRSNYRFWHRSSTNKFFHISAVDIHVMWKEKGKMASSRGKSLHAQMEVFWNALMKLEHEKQEEEKDPTVWSESKEQKRRLVTCDEFLDLWVKYVETGPQLANLQDWAHRKFFVEKWDCIRTELKMFHPKYGLAGTIDALFKDPAGHLHNIDYKFTTHNLEPTAPPQSSFERTLKAPFDFLTNNHHNGYRVNFFLYDELQRYWGVPSDYALLEVNAENYRVKEIPLEVKREWSETLLKMRNPPMTAELEDTLQMLVKLHIGATDSEASPQKAAPSPDRCSTPQTEGDAERSLSGPSPPLVFSAASISLHSASSGSSPASAAQ